MTNPESRGADQAVDELHLPVVTPGTDAQRPSGQGVIAIPIVDGHRGGVRPGRWPSAEELSALGHVLVPRPIREQAVIPHAVEAAREHMQEDAPDELRRGQGHGLLTRCVGTAVVGVAEPDLPRVEGEEPLVGDGDPMRVPTDVIEHLVGPGEGWLGVDHPVGLPGGLEMGGKVLPIVEGVECAGEVQLAGLERLAHGVEQQPANEPGEHPDREEEPGAARHPLRTIGRESPAGDHAVEVGMMHQGLAPGVEHRKEPDLGAQMTGIRRDGPQRLGDRPEEEAIDDGLVLVGDGGDRRGHREDDVEVVDGEQVRSARASDWHVGQWRLRHELYQTRWCPHRSHCSTWPPRAAVRQASIAVMTRRSAVESEPPAWAR